MEQIGEYIVRRLIGEGGMGRVYEAEERLSKRRVALKVLRDELTKSEHARGMFLNEMQILAHLEHANIVRSLASIETDGKLVTVLEYLEGRTLREVLIERSRLPWEEAAYVVICIARALVAAHGQTPPVIHRDLKPENTMVLDDGTVKVMDFGIAKLVQELNQTNTQTVGTLQYMSPEQIDAHTVDHRTDLYCLGLVLYELLAGRPPFLSSSPRALLNMQCTDAPPPLDDAVRAGIPKGIEKVLFQLLEKDPADRPASAAAVVETLELFLPERSFASLGERSTAARSTDRSPSTEPERDSSGQRSSGSVSTQRNDTLPSAQDAPVPAGERAGESARKDAIVIVERASPKRELSTGLSMVIIAALMIAAATATYLWRASQQDDAAGGDESARPHEPAE